VEFAIMTNMRRVTISGIHNKFSLDPILDKDVFKEKITRSILEQVSGSMKEEVFAEVDADYERLLASATILTHIPVLVEGEVRAIQRRKYRHMSHLDRK
jgi:hypothetical protein